MKILILSSSHPYQTAGIVAKDMLDGLLQSGEHEVKLLVKPWDKYPHKNIISMQSHLANIFGRISGRVVRFLRKNNLMREVHVDINYTVHKFDETITYYSAKEILKKIGFKPDKIIVLFMVGFVSYKNLYELHKITGAKIFLYPLDMAPYTGGCHWAWDCKGYTNQCGNCPALYSNSKNDMSNKNFKFKKFYLNKTDISVIASTEWTYQQLLVCSLFQNSYKTKILIPVDDSLFKPANKLIIRKELGLPSNKKIIFFGAVSVAGKRKGMTKLLEALNKYSYGLTEREKNNIHLLIAGNRLNISDQKLPFPNTTMGYLSLDELPKAYQAADIYVSPSIEDAGPMMVNQAIMCGTPVVSFEVGVSLDLVRTGETGYLAKSLSSNELANGIKYVLSLPEEKINILSINCANLGKELYTLKKTFQNWNSVLVGNIKHLN